MSEKLIDWTGLKPNEKCYGLLEAELSTPDSRSKHRYQIIYVVRDDEIVKTVRDLGNIFKYPHPELQIVMFGEHSVAEAQWMADDIRDRSDARSRILADEEEMRERFVPQAVAEAEQRAKVKANKSHYGPLSTGETTGTERIGFHHG